MMEKSWQEWKEFKLQASLDGLWLVVNREEIIQGRHVFKYREFEENSRLTYQKLNTARE